MKANLQGILSLGYNGEPYERLTREALVEWMHGLNSNGYSEETIRSYRQKVKTFLRWVLGCRSTRDPTPDPIRCIVIHKPTNQLPEGILTLAEIRRILDILNDQRNRALIHVGYEAGTRAAELLGLRLQDIELDRWGAVLLVKGKTGSRRIRLVEAVPDLQLWLSMHPKREAPKAYLWPSESNANRPITEERFNMILKRAALKAGISKRVYPHLLRHSRATHLAKVLTEAQLRIYFGWTKRSDIPARYVHLSGRDVDETLLRHYGIEQAKEESIEDLKPRSCPRCSAQNSPSALYCMRCSMCLDPRAAVRTDELRERAERAVTAYIRETSRLAPEAAEQAAKRSGIAEIYEEFAKLCSARG